MQTLAAGSPERRSRRLSTAGFTLLELLVVLAIVGLAVAGVSLAMRDGTHSRLERETLRLGALLEAARARSQALGLPLAFQPRADGFVIGNLMEQADTPPETLLRWLDADTRVSLAGDEALPATSGQAPTDAAPQVLLGPEPIITPQALTVYSAADPQRRLRLATDGVRPFAVQALP